jgi:hypothetical protein
MIRSDEAPAFRSHPNASNWIFAKFLSIIAPYEGPTPVPAAVCVAVVAVISLAAVAVAVAVAANAPYLPLGTRNRRYHQQHLPSFVAQRFGKPIADRSDRCLMISSSETW